MDLRQMPELQEIAMYLRTMEIKRKAFGGCDYDNVLDHFLIVTQKYEAVLAAVLEQCARQQELIRWYEEAYASYNTWQNVGYGTY